MRWKLKLGALIGAVGIATGGVFIATAGTAHAWTTVTFTEHETNVQFVVDGHSTLTPPQGDPAPGDQIIFRSDLIQNGVVVGFTNGQCTVIFNNNGLCHAVFAFTNKGDIMITALLRGLQPQVFDASVVGGTFAYNNFHGDAHAVSTNDTDTNWTLNLATS
ncbi:MAG: hypothetical protein ACYDH6_06840 [Acidimicrobiales bacterium]